MSWEGDFIMICLSTAGQPSLDNVFGWFIFQWTVLFFSIGELRVSAREARQEKWAEGAKIW